MMTNKIKNWVRRLNAVFSHRFTPQPVASDGSSRAKIRGFTLLELLIVIAILAIISIALILVLNPAETLRKSRDTQRISDLSTLKTALGIYTTTVSSPSIGADADCLGYASAADVTTAVIFYSKPQTADPACAVNVAEGTDVETGSTFGGVGGATDSCKAVAVANNTLVDGSGWIPVNFGSITGGSPISSLPVDPTNNVSGVGGIAPASTDLVYRYACQKATNTTPLKPTIVYELDARFESTAYGPSGDDDKSAKDGGDNDAYYEVGSSTKLMGAGTNY